jgi:hypothetical protein
LLSKVSERRRKKKGKSESHMPNLRMNWRLKLIEDYSNKSFKMSKKLQPCKEGGVQDKQRLSPVLGSTRLIKVPRHLINLNASSRFIIYTNTHTIVN